MVRPARRQQITESLEAQAQMGRPSEPPICPLCERPIPVPQREAHHLVHRSCGGRVTEYLHRICHRQIHAQLTETELARDYNTVEALMAHVQIVSFVAWVRGKPPDFTARSRKSQRLREH